MGILKTVVRIGIVTVGVTGVLILVAGPQRTSALFNRLRGAVGTAIDKQIDDPSALRTQLRTLEEQYPQRITDLRGDLAQLVEQRRQMERDKAVAERVVVLADADLAALKPLLAQAEAARGRAAPGQVITVRFDTDALPLEQAAKRAAQIAQTRVAYAGRAKDGARDLSYLGQQQDRLETLLHQLETEREEFQAQVWQLDRQVDSIARNDRLIELMQRRQKTMDECSRYEAGNLDQIQGRMSEVRSRQEAELELLASTQHRLDYEDLARDQLDLGALPETAGTPATEYLVVPAPQMLSEPGPETAPGGAVENAASSRGEVRVETVGPRPR